MVNITPLNVYHIIEIEYKGKKKLLPAVGLNLAYDFYQILSE